MPDKKRQQRNPRQENNPPVKLPRRQRLQPRKKRTLSYTSFTLPDGHRRGFLLHRTSVLAYTGNMIYNEGIVGGGHDKNKLRWINISGT